MPKTLHEVGRKSFIRLRKQGKSGFWNCHFSTPVNYVQICVDGQEVLSPDLPIAHGYGRPYNYIELPDEDGFI